VKCDCGQVQDVPYGQRWECPACERRWNTGQIPEEEYLGIMRDMRRYRIQAMIVGGAIAIAVFGFTLWTGQSVIPMAMIAMTFWLLIFMPRWRRKIRWHTRNLPKWTLHPE
jgi:hypothetical protein